MVQMKTTTTTPRSKTSLGAVGWTNLCLVMVGQGRKRFLLVAIVLIIMVAATTWNSSSTFDTRNYYTLQKQADPSSSTTTSSSPSDENSNFLSSSTAAAAQQPTKKRVSYDELFEIMSPPGIDNPMTASVASKVKGGMMVKCDIERWSGYLRREHYYIYDGLAQIYGWEEITLNQVRIMAAAAAAKNSNNNKIENDNKDDKGFPQVLFLCEPAILHLDHLLPWLKTLKEERGDDIHIAYHTDDLTSLMNKVSTHQLAEAFKLFDTYMGTYAYRIQHYLSQVPIQEEEMPQIVWIPHSVSPEFLQPSPNNNNHIIDNNINNTMINPSAKRRVMMPGKVNVQYPIRKWAQDSITDLPMLDILAHSGYAWNHGQNQQVQFANHVASYTAAFTCGLFHHYIVAKMFEIPAVGTLLLVNNDVSDLLRALGFIDGIHYKSYSSIDPKPTLMWAVHPTNQHVVDEMRRVGMDLVRQNHQVGHRVHAIVSYFATGKITYPIPETYKNDPCPVVTKLNTEECRKEFFARSTKPLLALK